MCAAIIMISACTTLLAAFGTLDLTLNLAADGIEHFPRVPHYPLDAIVLRVPHARHAPIVPDDNYSARGHDHVLL